MKINDALILRLKQQTLSLHLKIASPQAHADNVRIRVRARDLKRITTLIHFS